MSNALNTLSQFVRLHRELGGSVQLVPGEGLAINCALNRLEQHNREQLPVSKSLDPDVHQQPCVSLAGRMLSLQCKGQRRSQEVNQ